MIPTTGILALLAQEFFDVHVPIPGFGDKQYLTILLAFVKVGAIGFAVLWIASFIECEIGGFKRWRERHRYNELKKRFNSYKYRDKV